MKTLQNLQDGNGRTQLIVLGIALAIVFTGLYLGVHFGYIPFKSN